MRSFLSWFNIVIRAIMESGIVFAAGFWGYYIGQSMRSRILLTVVVPVTVFGLWGLIDFHQAGKYAEPLRLIQELFLSGLSAIFLFWSGLPLAGWILAIISIVHHALVYMIGERLLKSR